MIWHIFKKDWKLQWKFAVMLALLQFANAAVLVKLGFTDYRPLWWSLSQLLMWAALAGIPFLIVAVVHQDAIPGQRQDWLARPIKRSDLLLAKFVFVLVAVHGPMLLADLLHDLANGFAFGPSLAAAVSRGLFVLVAFSVPLLAFASLTRNIMEGIVAGLIVSLCFAGFMLLFQQTDLQRLIVGEGGLSWIREAALCLVGLAGAAAVLGLQYFRRRTIVARALAAGAAVLALLLSTFLPWNVAFALEQRLSPNPSAASAIAVSFDPGMGRYHRPYTGAGRIDFVDLHLPLRYENLSADSVLLSDRADVKWTEAGGATTSIGLGTEISIRQEISGAEHAEYLLVLVPAALYNRISTQIERASGQKNQPGQLEIELSLTLFRSKGSHAIPALNGNAQIPDLGRCTTRVDISDRGVRLFCVPLEDPPSCKRWYLRHIPTGRANPAEFYCQDLNYAPYFDALFLTPVFAWGVPFYDLSSVAGESQVVIETYKAVDHFTRTVVIPSTRLKDWTAQ
jgi:hypothetical protein